MDYIGRPHYASEILQNKFICTSNLFSTKKWDIAQSCGKNIWSLEQKNASYAYPSFLVALEVLTDTIYFPKFFI